MPKNRTVPILFIVLLGTLIYANTLNNAFVSDDIPAIPQNPHINNLLSSPDTVTFLNVLDYKIGKFNPPVYHLTNIFIHLMNSILVFFLLRLFFEREPSLWGSLIFVSHPVHAEAVTWISGKGYLLVTFFVLVSFLFYADAAKGPALKKGKYAVSLAAFVLSLVSGTIGVLYPAALVLFDVVFGRFRKNWKLWPAFFLLVFVKLLFLHGGISQRIAEVRADGGQAGTSNVFFNTAFSVFSHLGLLAWPQKLTLYHEPVVLSPFVLKIELFFLAVLAVSMPVLFKRSKVIFFAACFFVLFLSPTFSPVMISWLVAERYLYLPSISWSIGAAFLAERCSRTYKTRATAGILMALLIAAYSVRTVIRNLDWKTHASIWRATAKVSPESPKAHNNMGDVYMLEGNMEKAAEEFRRAVELRPDYADAYHNLANVYRSTGRLDEAAANYEKAAALNPRLYQSYINLAGIYFQKGLTVRAKEYLEKALAVKPDDESVKQALASLERAP